MVKLVKRGVKKLLKSCKDYINFRNDFKRKNKLNVGAGTVAFDKSWFSCDIDILDLTKKEDWVSLLKNQKASNIFAEHVWEHLTAEDTALANRHCYEFLMVGGRLRIAVPDGFHPSPEYINYVKPNGSGVGSDDHKILYNYKKMKVALEKVGFKVDLLEYWDENKEFHYVNWSSKHGKVTRSRRYDPRNKNGELNYTSLIVDAIK